MKKKKNLILWLFSGILLTVLISFTAFFALTGDVRLDKSLLTVSHRSVRIFDKDDVECTDALIDFSKDRLDIQTLDEKVKWAFIDTEDKRFYSHHGFDYKRIAKAVVNNLKSRSFKEGASTISQQLVKNTHLTQEKTLIRKMKEFKLTFQLELEYSKDEILEKYLSTIYFGHNCFGIQSAASFYFDKPAKELNYYEGALLAGLVRSPNNYSPFKHPEKSMSRRNLVLSLMYKSGHISSDEYEVAKNLPVPVQTEKDVGATKPYFSNVMSEFEELTKDKKYELQGDISIYTYLDKSLQNELYDLAKTQKTDSVLCVADNKEKGYSAYYSSVGEIRRSPASLIKPLAVYAPAIENGIISPATPILDEETDFGNYVPKNYENEYQGYLSVRQAFSLSKNVPAVKILLSVGIENGISALKKMGITLEEDDASLALALGGMKNGLTMQELVSAYSVFYDNGYFSPIRFIKKIEVNGQTFYENPNEKIPVFSKETAYLTADMMRTTVETGTAKKLRALPFPVYAKTGTNGFENGNLDAYTLAFTSENIVGVWLGNRDNTLLNETGGKTPANLVYKIFSTLSNGQKILPIPMPDSVEKVALEKTEYDENQRLFLAEKNTPKEYVFYELFAKKYLPKAVSDKFAHPTVNVPSFTFENGKMTIDLQNLPSYFSYKIERFDGKTNKELFFGNGEKAFVDVLTPSDSNYRYTLTPYYKSNRGVSVFLPQISYPTSSSLLKPIENPSVADENWWEK